MSFTIRNVLISDEVDDKCVNKLESNGIAVTKNTKLTKQELIAEIPKYDGLIVRSATKVTADVIEAGTKLKIIGRAGTGVDNIDCPAATNHGVIVMNTPGGNTLSAAEHTCTLLLSMARHVAQGTESLRAGRWDRKKLMGNEVNGKTLAIIGLGRIGKEVATRMQAFGMTTIGHDPCVKPDVSAAWNCQWLPLEEVWKQADFITVHTPLIAQTRNLINDEVFAACKPGVRVINCARGGIIDEDALLRALNDGKCGGAGLDVFMTEPPTNAALIAHPLVTSTPHLGASTVEAQTRVAEDIAQQMVDLVQGRGLVGAINAQAVTLSLGDVTKPWVSLGTALGALAKRLVAVTIDKSTEVIINTHGAALKQSGTYLQAAALVGLLRGDKLNGLNLVSAPAKAKEMGLQIVTAHHEDSFDIDAHVTIEVKTSICTHTVTGLVNAGKPLLTAINDYKFAQGVVLSGSLLVYRSQQQALLSVIEALTTNKLAVQSFNSSIVVDGETWNVITVAPHRREKDPNMVPVIKEHVNFACKLTLA